MKWYVVYSGRVSRTQSSFQTCHEQVNGYKNNCYRGFKTRDGAEDDYSKFIVKLKINHVVGKGACQIGLSRLNDFIIFIQFIVFVRLLLT